ncbi:MAG: glycosyltransferase N-terminal domain-containing protein [Verrucomicrobiota bacterium]
MIFPFLFALSSPYYFFRLWRRGNWRKGFLQRFGYYDENVKRLSAEHDVIWIHAVSVGEIMLCTELVRVLESRQPNLQFLVSTTTTTGMGELQKRLPGHVAKIYYPIDFPTCVRRALETIKPKAIIFVEAEIWPNFIWKAADQQIPLFLANARISDRSYPRYLKCPFLFRKLFGSFVAVGAQSQEYALRLLEVGCQPANVEVTGNIKFDTAVTAMRNPLDAAALLAQVGVSTDTQILLGGSTHNGEEEMLANQFQRLRQKLPSLFLVLVPRHHERAQEVGRILEKAWPKIHVPLNCHVEHRTQCRRNRLSRC